MSDIHYRTATADDARNIAELVAISSDGVAVIEWQSEANKRKQCSALDVGAETYRQPDGNYSYRHCLIAEVDDTVAGMLLTFPVSADCAPRTDKSRPTERDSNVFAPYMYLEEPDSWYICGVALYPAYRGKGIGTQFMNMAELQAHDHGYAKLSLVAFEQNTGSVRLYQRLGFTIVDQAPVVPHPCIPYTGSALLMVKPL